jgi:hypothetical protein
VDIRGFRINPDYLTKAEKARLSSIIDQQNNKLQEPSIVIDEDGVILAGNGTVEQAGQVGIEKVQVVDADGDTLIAVRRTGLTDEQKRKLAYYDNRTADLAEWDVEQITADINAIPNMVRMTVGRTVKKFSEVMQEDGTMRRSSVCTSSYNAYERCCELWSKEEQYTDGYSKAGQYPNKYQTRWQRRAHFDNELKFAGAKAETKAHLKTIRELAGLMTGYKADDLKSGVLVFVKIRRSSAILKMESAARLTALSRGERQDPAALLFAPPEPELKRQMLVVSTPHQEADPFDDDFEPAPVMKPAQKPTLTTKEILTNTITLYIERGLLSGQMLDEAKRILGWLGKITTPPEESKNWPDVLRSFKLIDESVISEGRIPHGLG